MARSKCISCNSNSFEVVTAEPRNSNYILMFVQCASCGGVVGVLEYENLGAKNDILSEKVEKIERNLSALGDGLNHNFRVINENIKFIMDKLR